MVFNKSFLLKLNLLYFTWILSGLIQAQNSPIDNSIQTKDIVETLYQQHSLSLELKNNEKKGYIFIDYLEDENYHYEIALVDRNPVKKIDSEDILKITLKDKSPQKNVLQVLYDRGINDMQDFDKETIIEFSKIFEGKAPIKLIPVFSFDELKQKVYQLQIQKSNQ